MNQSFSIQSAPVVHRGTSTRRTRIVTATLWMLQAVLALVFLFAGSMKLITPVEVMAAQMSVALPGWFVQFIGVAEVAGALGLILPALTRIQRPLTPLAACGLVIIMGGATVVTLIGGGGASALFPLVVGLLLIAIAYGRRSFFKAA
ncbi:DoxX family protein [Ktedonobacter racemifer]|uniref:DoxX family protein n=1 Tax=Ktedonobacter racemifer DSM 44963 TaxID=485913 RepID=D6TCH3_KTERA|nr:DoxX family protein [Ktedonobacter racemifer]EFH89990.1 DoxX family protein [Ktedonobacter racemifer DSM 44963]